MDSNDALQQKLLYFESCLWKCGVSFAVLLWETVSSAQGVHQDSCKSYFLSQQIQCRDHPALLSVKPFESQNTEWYSYKSTGCLFLSSSKLVGRNVSIVVFDCLYDDACDYDVYVREDRCRTPNMVTKKVVRVFVCVTITMFTSERIATEHGVTMKHYHEAPMDSSKQTYSQSNWISASQRCLLLWSYVEPHGHTAGIFGTIIIFWSPLFDCG